MEAESGRELVVRVFQEDDAEALSRLILENLETVNVQTYGKAAVRKLASLYTPAHILKYARKGDMYVAELPGDSIPAGTVTLEGERVRNLFIRTDLHGRGIGKKLMLIIASIAVEKSLPRLTLLADLTAADFYENLGYRRIGERLELIKSARFRMVALEKDLQDGSRETQQSFIRP